MFLNFFQYKYFLLTGKPLADTSLQQVFYFYFKTQKRHAFSA